MITRMLGITAMIALNSLAHSHAPFPSTTPRDHASHTQAKKKNKLTSSSHTKAEDVETIHESSSKKKL